MGLTKIGTDGVKDDAVTTDKLANAINTERTANTAKVQTTINNNADNRVITGSGTASTLEGEANLTWDATTLKAEAANPVLELSGTAGTSGNTFMHINANANHWCIGADNYSSQNLFVIKDGTPSSSTHRFAIDSSGNVGIGTSSPQEILHVKAASEAIGNRDGVIFGSTDSLAADKGLPLVWAAHIGTDADYGIASICGRKENATNDNGAGYIQFGVGNAAGAITECARFISSGFLKAKGNSASYHNVATGYHELIGDTVHDVVAKLKHNSSTGYGLQTLFNHANANIYALSVRDYSGGTNTDKAFIRCDGDLENANNSYGGMSDVKLKENIVDAKSQWDDIKALKVRNFNYKVDENKTKLLGLVAQEAEAVCPSLVKSQPDLGEDNEDLGTETKVLKYSIVYMKAVKALQEAMAKIEVLETKVAALEAA